MTQPARRPATYDELLALPETVIGEIVDGELIASPRSVPSESLARSALMGMLGSPFQFGDNGPGGWWILLRPELHLGEHVLVPDLAGWRRERMPALPKAPFFELAPDWVCEVISPSSAAVIRGAKGFIYAEHGVGFLWIVDPVARTLEMQRNEAGKRIHLGAHGDADVVRIEPFEAVELKLGRLWGLE